MTMTLVRSDTGVALWKIAAPYLVEEREVTADQVRKSIEWDAYKIGRQAKIPYFLGSEPSFIRRLGYRVIEGQRAFYEWLLDSFPVPELIEKVLNRTLWK